MVAPSTTGASTDPASGRSVEDSSFSPWSSCSALSSGMASMARRQPESMAMSFNWAVVSGGSSRVTGSPSAPGRSTP